MTKSATRPDGSSGAYIEVVVYYPALEWLPEKRSDPIPSTLQGVTRRADPTQVTSRRPG